VRDPDAFLASDGRAHPVPYPPGATSPGRAPWRSLVTWLLLHAEADRLDRHDPARAVVLYEDLVDAPTTTAGCLARRIDPNADVRRVFDGDRLVVGHTGHAVGGNPGRPRPGRTVVTGLRPAAPTPALGAVSRRVLLPLARARYRRYVRAARRQISSGTPNLSWYRRNRSRSTVASSPASARE
jgi:hypothetical protein